MPGQDDTWEVESDVERFLDAPEHAWWTGTGPADPDDQPVAESDPEEAAEPAPEPRGTDPYAVLRIARHATWEEILTAYRRQVRWWHPDGLSDADQAEREACEERIRVLNAAYYELRVRRGR